MNNKELDDIVYKAMLEMQKGAISVKRLKEHTATRLSSINIPNRAPFSEPQIMISLERLANEGLIVREFIHQYSDDSMYWKYKVLTPTQIVAKKQHELR